MQGTIDDKLYDKIRTQIKSIDEFENVELVSEFQISHTILKSKNKINALKFYLESNQNDTEGDSWIYGHNPNIIEHLNSFSAKDYQTLNIESENWDDNTISSLADPIFQCNNMNVRGCYFSCKIFLQISIFDDLEYLIENLAAIAWSIKDNKPKDFYERLLKKAIEVNEKSNGNYDYTIKRLKIKADNTI